LSGAAAEETTARPKPIGLNCELGNNGDGQVELISFSSDNNKCYRTRVRFENGVGIVISLTRLLRWSGSRLNRTTI
jgi:hypothetical protein